ncbi:hypothetical protein [Streptomyces sp. SPB074]|uniref:hypothetical protein n=1 Tax=Streptomyces sp. (strain SPB074) TaxID=465543 RepID=UPI00017F0E33|nr:hypothetical protein [Streptomyces sp. SPB074]
MLVILSLSLALSEGMAVAAPVDPPSAAPAAVVDPPLADGEIEQVGPGVYSTSDKTFEVYETDVAEGVMGRSHTVTAQAGGRFEAEAGTRVPRRHGGLRSGLAG